MATTRPPATYADLAHENLHLLAALWRRVWHFTYPPSNLWQCLECDATAIEKHIVKHQPGCALFGQDPALLAQIDEWDRMPECV